MYNHIKGFNKEFFRIIDKQATEEQLQAKIHPKSIEEFTETMLFLESDENNFLGATLWRVQYQLR
ncbi:MAG TPA: hypothetical protein VLM44_04205 [Lutibacter sp.]|nr:hypothetical protein [Lutibacter sp.]